LVVVALVQGSRGSLNDERFDTEYVHVAFCRHFTLLVTIWILTNIPELLTLFLQYGFSVSPEDQLEMEAVDEWLEMMADFESAEADHLIALAMR
jgi:hypothetical protein